MAAKAGSTKESHGRIAAFQAKYSNKGTAAGYRGAIEAFLRCVYNLAKMTEEGTRAKYNYEILLDQYIADKKRDHPRDITEFSACLVKESVSNQSARQRLTYAVKFLRAQGIAISPDDIQDLKRENKGGAATIQKALKNDMICRALQGTNVRDRAIFLTLASSGLRVGELCSLDQRDIDLNSSPVKITIRAAKSKNKHARFTFCSDEARDAINAWLKNRDEFMQGSVKRHRHLVEAHQDGKVKTGEVQVDSTLLFPVSDSMINQAWEACLKKAGIYEKDTESGRNIYRLHSLRKFFKTQLSNTNAIERDLVEFFLGHLSELGKTYYVPSEEHAAIEYLKVMDAVTCCTPEGVKTQLKVQGARVADLENITKELHDDKIDQRESLDWLRENNERLQKQMAAQQKQIAEMQFEMKALERGASTVVTDEMMEQILSRLPNATTGKL